MALSIGGNKNKSKSTSNQTMNQTSTSALTGDSRALLQQRLAELNGQEYSALDPNAYEAFMDPFTGQVIEATTRDINASRDEEANMQRQQALGRSALGSSDRRGVREAELTGRYDRTLASTIAGLRSSGFRQAQGVAQAENANRNSYQASLQQQINQLLSLLANDRVTTTTGNSSGVQTGKQTGMNFGFTYGGGS